MGESENIVEIACRIQDSSGFYSRTTADNSGTYPSASHESTLILRMVCVAQSIVFFVVYFKSFFVLVFFRPLYTLAFFDLRFTITTSKLFCTDHDLYTSLKISRRNIVNNAYDNKSTNYNSRRNKQD